MDWDEDQLINTFTYNQCRLCRFRDKRYRLTIDGDIEEYGWDKCFCQIYGRDFVLNEGFLFVAYLPDKEKDKPHAIATGERRCMYCEKDKKTLEENKDTMKALTDAYQQKYIEYYGKKNLNSRNIPKAKDKDVEEKIWDEIKEKYPELIE